MYVSAGTAGIGISYAASPASFPNVTTPDAAFNVSSGSSLCATSGGTRTCTLTLPALIGTDDFQITAWNQAPLGGAFSGASALSAATLPNQTVSKGMANQINVTLDGVLNSVALAVTPTALPAQPTGSAAETATLSAVGYDAAGDAIVGGFYDANGNAISLSPAQTALVSGESVLMTLSNGSLSSSTSTLTISYTGGGYWGSAFVATPSESIPGTSAGVDLAITPTITEFPVPTSSSEPFYITSGPDGNLWFTELEGDNIAKITTSGTITTYSIPTSDSAPSGIASGPDGNLWFVESNSDSVAKITTAGAITAFSGTGDGRAITSGSDGNLWFTLSSAIGKITTSGTVTTYGVPTSPSDVLNITSGPDGNLWFPEFVGDSIGNVTTSGTFATYDVPTSEADPYAITTGSDGNLWFTENIGNNIARITTSGTITTFALPTSGAKPLFITSGADGNLWFTESGINSIGKITTSGAAITEYIVPTSGASVFDITSGPDGNLWFTETDGDKIGRLIF